MKLRGVRTLALGAAVTSAASGMVGVSAGPANASLAECGSGYLCAYAAANYNTTPGRVSGNNNDLLQYASFDNAVSIYNNGASCGVTIWNGRSRTGTSVYLPRGTGYGNLNTQNPPFYKNVASNRWC